MNGKMVIVGFVLLAAGCCHAAPPVPIPASAILDTPPGFNAGAGAALLTDGTIGTDNWLSPMSYLGWADPGYVPADGGTDSGTAQPQLTFNLAGTYFVDTITIHYIVDYPAGSLRANVRAPDSVTASFGMSGAAGSFGGNIVDTAFDDGPEGNAASGGGAARTLVLNAGGMLANAVRLDFRTDGEWLMLSEVSFQGRPTTNVAVRATAILDTPANFNGAAGPGLLTDGVVGGDDWLSFGAYQGWQDAGYVPADAGTDTGIAQPQLTFDLGGTYMVDSVTVHYNVDYPPGSLRANLRAPDSMTVTLSDAGPGGPFGGSVVETGFDDSPEGNAAAGVGQARSLITPLGMVSANALRLDFRTDGEWVFLSEVTIRVLAELTNAPPPVTNDLISAAALMVPAPGFNAAAGAALLSDGVVGGNNWLVTPWQYLGWADPGYVPTDAGTDSGSSQPQLTFDLGGNYIVDTITIHYIVDYPTGTLRANLRAPDVVTATFGASGVTGPFDRNVVETGFNDGPESNATGGGGEARSVTMSVGSQPANALRLDFRTDGEWLFLSELVIRGRALTNTPVAIPATAIRDTPATFNADAGAALLTDGIIGGNNWLVTPWRYMGWLDAGYVPSDAGTDTGVAQPQLTFDFGASYWLDSVTIHYMVDYPPGSLHANVRAPDSMTAMFSASGAAGPFGGNVVETGFDDSPEADGNAGGGQARSLTLSLGGTQANAMRLDFRTDGEWFFISEVVFRGTAVPSPSPAASLVGAGGSASIRIRYNTQPGLWYRVVRADSLPAVEWTAVGGGWREGLGLPMEVLDDASIPGHLQGYYKIEVSPTPPE